MYSILLKLINTTSDRYKFLLNSNGEIYTEDNLVAVREKIIELLQEYPLDLIKVVKNCNITMDITIEEVNNN